ncbi:MAG: CBS domain-containing protein [Spirochaetes bacterium]|jgi:CBS domain-containing protein|nr:CBS domain-containing protein [Spirochaetota bacterium]
MFHIHTFNGVQYNVPLESLKKSDEVSRLEKSYQYRKVIDKKTGEEKGGGGGKFPHAVKAYRDAIKISDEREPILHAYTIMKSPVLTLRPGIKIADAWNLFQEKGVRHMPVLSDKNEILGIVSDRDLLKRLIVINNKIENVTDTTAADVMTEEVITAGRFTDIRRIAKAMFEHHLGTMPILDDAGQLEGIITRSDILYALINYPELKLWA